MTKNTIHSITAREILSSGGSPTVEVRVKLSHGTVGIASVPFGVSAGAHEALTLVDGDPKRYGGQGMLKACANIETKISPALKGMPITDQQALDKKMIELDGTENKGKLGGNSILAVSLACARAGASAEHIPLYAYIRSVFKLRYPDWRLPKPMMVMIEGGKHASNSTDFQEYLMSISGAKTLREAVRWGEEAYHQVKKVLQQRGLDANVGNEGAFAPAGLTNNEEPLKILSEAIAAAGYRLGKDISLSIDPATSELYSAKDRAYYLKRENATLSSDQMIALFSDWIEKYRLLSVEDGLAEDDWEGWKKFFSRCGSATRIVGDDLTVTNPIRLKKAIAEKAINAVLIKLNQVGTLSETVATVKLGQKHGYWQIVSHRGGGETNDSFMIDLAAAVNAEYVKVGPTRGERVAKYNRLVEIEDELAQGSL